MSTKNTNSEATLESIKAELEQIKASNTVAQTITRVEGDIATKQAALTTALHDKETAYEAADATAYSTAVNQIEQLTEELDALKKRLDEFKAMKQISSEDYAQYDTRIKEVVAQKEAEQLSTIISLLNQIYTVAEENKNLCESEEEVRTLLHIGLNKEPAANLLHVDAKYFGYKLADRAQNLKSYCEDFIA